MVRVSEATDMLELFYKTASRDVANQQIARGNYVEGVLADGGIVPVTLHEGRLASEVRIHKIIYYRVYKVTEIERASVEDSQA